MNGQKESSIAEVKSELAALVRTVERGKPVIVTRHGRRVAALVPIAEYERWTDADRIARVFRNYARRPQR